MLIVLNDNEMSISPTVGAISHYLSRIKLSRTWRGSQARLRGLGRAHPIHRSRAGLLVAPLPQVDH